MDHINITGDGTAIDCGTLEQWMNSATDGNFTRGMTGWQLNCDDHPNGVSLYNNWLKENSNGDKTEDFQNCESWILVLGANAYPWQIMAFAMLMFLLFTFLGINIVADVFMSAIEVITSSEKSIKNVTAHGEEHTITTKVWNPTVANLSLMALGSSAPEIMLAVLDVCQTLGSPPGELGASTIVGSAAFNLFVISAVCVTALPVGELKKIEQMGVFAITAFSSIFAYVWMVIVLSDEYVDLWEALVTFFFFPTLLVTAYFADVKGGKTDIHDENQKLLSLKMDGDMAANKDQVTAMIKSIQQKEGKSADEIAKDIMASSETVSMSRNQYRINANKALSGRRRALPKGDARTRAADMEGNRANEKLATVAGDESPSRAALLGKEADELKLIEQDQLCWVYLRSTRLAAFENEEKVDIIVERKGCLDSTITVDFATTDDTATAGEDYVAMQDSLTFEPGEAEKQITVVILNDNQWEPDEDFSLTISNPQFVSATKEGLAIKVRDNCQTIVCTIIDDDEPGVLGFFDTREYRCSEACKMVEITVIRKDGADGIVTCQYETIDGTAVAGVDYTPSRGTLHFPHQELIQTVEIEVIDNTTTEEKDAVFQVVLSNPGGGALIYKKGGGNFATVSISNDDQLTETVNKLTEMMEKRQAAFSVESSSWIEQFHEAFACEGGVDEHGEESQPSFFDYVMHFLTLGWKVLFAAIPPTDYCGGWMTFGVSLCMIGLVTMIVGEAAAAFGCFCGLEDSITAITFVALGTSLPDLFASQHAAKDDSSADASIGNVTGSNSVNVFLGLGLPWVIATIYSLANPSTDPARAANPNGYYVPKEGGLSFSVTIFAIMALICISTLMLRRKVVGAELGGGKCGGRITALFFVGLWCTYITLSIAVTKKWFDSPFSF